MSKSNRTILGLLVGLAACFSTLGLVGPWRVYGAPLPQCPICGCKYVNAYSAQGAAPVDPTWFYYKNPDGSTGVTTQALSTIQTSVMCDNGNATPTLNQVVYPVKAPAPQICTPVPPGPGQTIYLQLDASNPPVAAILPPMGTPRFGCIPPQG